MAGSLGGLRVAVVVAFNEFERARTKSLQLSARALLFKGQPQPALHRGRWLIRGVS